MKHQKEVTFHYYTWCAWKDGIMSFKEFLKVWFFHWATDHLDDLWTEFYIRLFGFTIKFREYESF